MRYFDELKRSMEWLSKKSNTIFIGQAVNVPGTAMSNTLKDIKNDRLIEFPVAEEFQMGTSIGMALNGTVPITIFPRWNFLLLAVNQLVNHLDKIKEYSNNEFNPKVIIRTSVGSKRPLHPQAQHVGNYSSHFKKLLTTIDLIQLKKTSDIFENYKYAYNRADGKSTILVEFGDYYNEK